MRFITSKYLDMFVIYDVHRRVFLERVDSKYWYFFVKYSESWWYLRRYTKHCELVSSMITQNFKMCEFLKISYVGIISDWFSHFWFLIFISSTSTLSIDASDLTAWVENMFSEVLVIIICGKSIQFHSLHYMLTCQFTEMLKITIFTLHAQRITQSKISIFESVDGLLIFHFATEKFIYCTKIIKSKWLSAILTLLCVQIKHRNE